MSIEEFSSYQVRHMLLAIRNWLRSEEAGEDGHITMDADAAESLGSALALDKPSAHRMLAALFEDGYLGRVRRQRLSAHAFSLRTDPGHDAESHRQDGIAS